MSALIQYNPTFVKSCKPHHTFSPSNWQLPLLPLFRHCDEKRKFTLVMQVLHLVIIIPLRSR